MWNGVVFVVVVLGVCSFSLIEVVLVVNCSGSVYC